MASERREFARTLRKHSGRTAEEILWERLRGSRFDGAKFRRQVPFDRFVVDFYRHAAKLAMELDGKQHEWFADYDAGRTEILDVLGVRMPCASRTPRCATILTLCWRGFAKELRLPFV